MQFWALFSSIKLDGCDSKPRSIACLMRDEDCSKFLDSKIRRVCWPLCLATTKAGSMPSFLCGLVNNVDHCTVRARICLKAACKLGKLQKKGLMSLLELR